MDSFIVGVGLSAWTLVLHKKYDGMSELKEMEDLEVVLSAFGLLLLLSRYVHGRG